MKGTLSRAPGTLRSIRSVVWLLLGTACGGASVAPSAPQPAPAPQSEPLPPPDRSTLPQPGATPDWAPPEPTAWTLPGGLRVIHRQHGAVPLVSVKLVFPLGSATDPPGKAGLTALMGDLLDEGAGDLGALALGDRLQALATDLGISASVDSLILSMNTIAENFAPSMVLLADVVQRPRFALEDFERRKAQHVAQALQQEADPHSARRHALYRALFASGYAGDLPGGTRRTLENLSHADVRAHHAALVVARGATLVVTGGIDRSAVERGIAPVFERFGGQASLPEKAVVAAPGEGKLYFADYPGAPQSVIGVVRRAPGAQAEDLFEVQVFNRSFGQSFASRVNLNLREEKGYTYGAFSMFRRFRQTGFFGIFADVRTDVTRQSLEEILRELSDVCGARPLSGEERDTSVNGLLLGYPGTFESMDRLAGRFADLAVKSRPLDWYSRWPERVEAVTLAGANAAAARYCDKSRFSLVVAGDAATVADELAPLGYSRVDIDATGRPL